MKATILIDNITKDSLMPEWGLAIFIEYMEHKFLLDTGASNKFIENAKMIGIDVGQADFGVLSHAHYDHADGLAAFFGENDHAKFYLRAGAGENCYGKRWIFSIFSAFILALKIEVSGGSQARKRKARRGKYARCVLDNTLVFTGDI